VNKTKGGIESVHPLHGPERSLAYYLGHRNPPLVTQRLRRIGLRSSGRISVWGEPLEARRTLSDFQGPSGLSLLTGTAPNILYVLAVDCVVAATGPKLFVDQIEADIGQSYGVSHSTISKL
jgi:hypothetical protein